MPIELGSFSIGSVAGTIVGGIAGHYLTKVRDKEARDIRDFNVAAEGLAKILEIEKVLPTPASGNIDFFAFRRVLGPRDLTRFDICVEEYETARKNAKTISKETLIRYHDITPIVAAIEKMETFTKRK
jgi:hypothetical protein